MVFSEAAIKLLIEAGPEIAHAAIKAFNEMKKETVTSADIQSLQFIKDEPFIVIDKDKDNKYK